jgi:Leucine-rich repeat (LRR) protein
LYYDDKIVIKNYDICEIDRNTFKDLPNIKTLSINGAKLHKIKKDTFKYLINLENLYLEKNQIEIINKNAFDFLPKLFVVSLTENNITKINEQIFKKFFYSFFDPTIKNIKSYKTKNMFCSEFSHLSFKYKKKLSYYTF